MGKARSIRKVFRSKPVIEGAGVHLKRAFGFGEQGQFDPFLLLDDFRSGEPDHYLSGFPWHPHRGIETITYVLCGDVEHGDSMGNKGSITAGDVQWMTAGSGVIHQEMPKGDSRGRLEGFQLWANLPAASKMMAPRYRDVKAAQIPEVTLADGVLIRIICGRVGDTRGPVGDIVIEPEYLDISVPPKTTYVHPTPADHTVFAYVIGGSGYFCPEKKPFASEAEGLNYFDMRNTAMADNETLILFDRGDHVFVQAEEEPVRFLLVSGKPIGEPVAWYGPIVMNTREELRIAFEEYEQGTFIKTP
jgi:redox-sensitive bicupin YhaK (pirin superfamily)